MEELAKRCFQLFSVAAGAVSRSAKVSVRPDSSASRDRPTNPEQMTIRDRVITREEVGSLVRFVTFSLSQVNCVS